MLNCNKRGGISFYIGDNKAEKPRPLFSLVAIASTNSCPSQDILSTPTNKRILPASHRYPKRENAISTKSQSATLSTHSTHTWCPRHSLPNSLCKSPLQHLALNLLFLLRRLFPFHSCCCPGLVKIFTCEFHPAIE